MCRKHPDKNYCYCYFLKPFYDILIVWFFIRKDKHVLKWIELPLILKYAKKNSVSYSQFQEQKKAVEALSEATKDVMKVHFDVQVPLFFQQ